MAERSTRLRSGVSLRSRDPARSRDPQLRGLIQRLRQLPAAPAPSAQFRAELRTQLVAVAPRLVAEGSPAEDSSRRSAPQRPAPARAGSGTLRRLASVRVGRPVAAVLGVLCVFAMLLGGAVWISGKAMPGDTLYMVKRATENARLALAGSDTEKARDYLSFAKTRANEVADLLGQPTAAAAAAGPNAAGGVSAHTAKLVRTTLDSADSDVRDASRLLSTKAVRDRTTAPLSVMTDWAPGQLARLQHIAARLPAGAVLDRVRASSTLVHAALTRAQKLRAGIGCSCLASAPSDELGPVPCTVCAPVVPTQGGTGTPPPPSTGTARRQPPSVPGGNQTPTSAPTRGAGGARHGSNPANPTTSAAGSGAGHAPPDASTSRRAEPPAHSTPGGRAGAASSSHSTPAGAAPRTTEPAQPSGGQPTPQPTRTCLIVLLGICI